MGSASIAGKLELHSSSQPKVNIDKCIGCRICEKNCNHGAITVNSERKAVIDYNKCVGCGQCVALCQYEGAVLADWDTSEVLNYKIAEYSKAILKDRPHFHISLIMNVSPECDCWGHNDVAIVPDLGMMASFDPVALDQACADMVNMAPAINAGCYHHNHNHSEGSCSCSEHDMFKVLHPDTDWKAGLRYAQEIGIGTREYELIEVK